MCKTCIKLLRLDCSILISIQRGSFKHLTSKTTFKSYLRCSFLALTSVVHVKGKEENTFVTSQRDLWLSPKLYEEMMVIQKHLHKNFLIHATLNKHKVKFFWTLKLPFPVTLKKVQIHVSMLRSYPSFCYHTLHSR